MENGGGHRRIARNSVEALLRQQLQSLKKPMDQHLLTRQQYISYSGLASLHRIVLSLVELSRAFGADGILEAARALEKSLHPFLEAKKAISASGKRYLNAMLARLRNEAAQWQPGTLPALPGSVLLCSGEENTALVYMVTRADGITPDFTGTDYRARCFADMPELAAACAEVQPNAIVIDHPAYLGDPASALQALAILQENFTHSIPAR